MLIAKVDFVCVCVKAASLSCTWLILSLGNANPALKPGNLGSSVSVIKTDQSVNAYDSFLLKHKSLSVYVSKAQCISTISRSD